MKLIKRVSLILAVIVILISILAWWQFDNIKSVYYWYKYDNQNVSGDEAIWGRTF